MSRNSLIRFALNCPMSSIACSSSSPLFSMFCKVEKCFTMDSIMLFGRRGISSIMR